MCTKLVQLQVHLDEWYCRDLVGEKKTIRPCSNALLPIHALLAGSIWQCPRRANFSGQYNYRFRSQEDIEGQGGVGRHKTNLIVVDDVDPWQDVDEQLRVPRVPSSHTLEIGRHLGFAVQGLALLHLVNHLPHIHLDFPGVLGESVETLCSER